MSARMGDSPNDMSVSRIRQYADQRAADKTAAQIASLEAELDQSERRNLRLNRELLNEATLRIRSEKERDELAAQVEGLQRRVGVEVIGVSESIQRPQRIEANSNSVGASGKVSSSRRPAPRVSRVPAEPTPTNVRGEPVKDKPKQSSRKRGGVK